MRLQQPNLGICQTPQHHTEREIGRDIIVTVYNRQIKHRAQSSTLNSQVKVEVQNDIDTARKQIIWSLQSEKKQK